MSPRSKQVWGAGAVVVAIGALVGVAFQGKTAAPESIGSRTTVERRAEYTVETSCRGQLAPIAESYLTVRNGGNLDEVLAKPGDLVNKGQILGIIEKTRAKAELQAALSRYTLAQKEFQRVSNLFRVQSSTAQELDEARSGLVNAKSALESARQQLEDGILRAPHDGYLSVSLFREGDYVPAGSRVMVVEDRTRFAVICKIPAQFAVMLPPSGTVEATAIGEDGSLDEARRARADATFGMVDESGARHGINADIRITFAKAPEGLPLKQQLAVKIPVRTYHDVALVSVEALLRRGSHPYFLTESEAGEVAWYRPTIIDQFQDKVVVPYFAAADSILVPSVEMSELEQRVKATL